MKLSCIIPAHNEEDCICETVSHLHTVLKDAHIDHEIRVVNDNSTDNTKEILENVIKNIPNLVLIDNETSRGFGFAVRKGLETFDGDAVCIYMSDASDSPYDVVRFFRAIETGYDCVFGLRWSKEAKVVDYPWLKRRINRLANYFIGVLFQIKYYDVTNAFKMYRAPVIEGLKPFLSQHFNLTVELPLKAIVRGYNYTVLPNSWINRKTGESKLKIKEMGSRYLFIVLYCFIEKWFSKGDYRRKDREVHGKIHSKG